MVNPKFQASSYLLWLYSLVFVEPGRKPRRPVFSKRGSSRMAKGRPGISYNCMQHAREHNDMEGCFGDLSSKKTIPTYCASKVLNSSDHTSSFIKLL